MTSSRFCSKSSRIRSCQPRLHISLRVYKRALQFSQRGFSGVSRCSFGHPGQPRPQADAIRRDFTADAKINRCGRSPGTSLVRASVEIGPCQILLWVRLGGQHSRQSTREWGQPARPCLAIETAQCRTGRLPCCAGDGQCIHGPDRALLVVLHGISYPSGQSPTWCLPREGVGGVWLGVGGDLPQLPA